MHNENKKQSLNLPLTAAGGAASCWWMCELPGGCGDGGPSGSGHRANKGPRNSNHSMSGC